MQQALELFRNLGDRDGEALPIAGLGVVQRLTGDYPAAMASLRQAREIFGAGRRPGQPCGPAWARSVSCTG